MYALTAEVRGDDLSVVLPLTANSNKSSMSPFIAIVKRSKKSVIGCEGSWRAWEKH